MRTLKKLTTEWQSFRRKRRNNSENNCYPQTVHSRSQGFFKCLRITKLIQMTRSCLYSRWFQTTEFTLNSNNRGGHLCSFLHSVCFSCMFLQQQLTQDIIDSDYISVKETADINLRKLHIEVQLFHKDKQEKVWKRQWNKKYAQIVLYPRNIA